MLRQLLILCIPVLFSTCLSACSSQANSPSEQICFADGCIYIEIVQTPEERRKGLQARKYLSKGNGMLFIFSESKKYSFWMKDTFIPLDIIWIDRNKRIVTIMSDVLPCEIEQCAVYAPDNDALYVLEVNAGVAIELGLKGGDQAVF